MSQPPQIAPNAYLLEGAVNTGLLIFHDRGLLIDCCDTVTPQRLRRLGVEAVDAILCTQHRRPNVAGARHFVDQGTQLIVPLNEQQLFEDVAAYWGDPANRWHIYHHRPSTQVLAEPLPVSRAVAEGDTLNWQGFMIRVLDTPGATDGSVSYLVQSKDTTICFCGDALYAGGQVWDFYSLQKGAGDIRDYHGFLGSRSTLIPTLRKLGECGADLLVPSHGAVINAPYAATALTLERLDAAWHNYTATSALNYYFPGFLHDTAKDPWRMNPAPTCDPPGFVLRCPDTTSFVVVSDSGAALLIDCGNDSVFDTLRQWMREGTIAGIDGCWITHYHDDHVDALRRGWELFRFPILADEHMAEIIEHPLRFFLPCISPVSVPVSRKTRNGQSWDWHEFRLTGFHFPGQSLYHGGLLVEGHGTKVFFAGDSGAPSGLDDYCCGNRNFLGADRGFRRCINIWRQVRPDFILNQHQEEAFVFDDRTLEYLDTMLVEREQIFSRLLPWAHPDFGTDEHWVRTYPYEQTAPAGSSLAIDVLFTNHGPKSAQAAIEPVLPATWTWDPAQSNVTVLVPARTDGMGDSFCPNPDGVASVRIEIPSNAQSRKYIVPFRVTWGNRYLGQISHAIVNILEE